MSRVGRSSPRKAMVAKDQLDLFARPVNAPAQAQSASQQVVISPPADPIVVTMSVAPATAPNVDRRVLDFVAGAQRKRGRPPKSLQPATSQSEDGKRLLDVREAAARLGLSKSTLDKMRCSGRGPRFIRATDRAVRYDPADLAAFANDRRRRSTSEEAIAALSE